MVSCWSESTTDLLCQCFWKTKTFLRTFRWRYDKRMQLISINCKIKFLNIIFLWVHWICWLWKTHLSKQHLSADCLRHHCFILFLKEEINKSPYSASAEQLHFFKPLLSFVWFFFSYSLQIVKSIVKKNAILNYINGAVWKSLLK